MVGVAELKTVVKANVDDDCEHVVIHHPVPGPVAHVHHGRVVAIHKDVNEITMQPMIRVGSDRTTGHDGTYRYTRTVDVTSEGLPIFRQTL